MAIKAHEVRVGMKVHYQHAYGECANGIIKTVVPTNDVAFVVYDCESLSDRPEDKGAITYLDDLHKGWAD